MDKTLIFISNKNSYFFPYIQSDAISVHNIWNEKYQGKNTFFMRICRKLKLPLGLFWGDWKENVTQYSRVIIFDGCYDKLLTYYLNKQIPEIPKYIFCWNGKHRLGHVLDAKYPIYSYSPRDCRELGLIYKSTVFSKDVVVRSDVEEYDILYLGQVKERLNKLEEIYLLCQKLGLRSKFIVIGEAESEVLKVQQDKISYLDYLGLVAKSKAILDFSTNNQDGLSLRPMEALFFEKKLITDNADIVHYDFYRPENVFVFDGNKDEQLKTFILQDTVSISNEIVEKYEINHWVTLF